MEQKRKLTDVGDVKVHNNAIKSITELAISRIKGVVGVSKSPFKKVLDTFAMGRSLNLFDGIKVESDDAGIKIALNIIVAYGHDISEIATKIQDEVKQAVENMTGITSVEVYVNVTGVEKDGGEK